MLAAGDSGGASAGDGGGGDASGANGGGSLFIPFCNAHFNQRLNQLPVICVHEDSDGLMSKKYTSEFQARCVLTWFHFLKCLPLSAQCVEHKLLASARTIRFPISNKSTMKPVA